MLNLQSIDYLQSKGQSSENIQSDTTKQSTSQMTIEQSSDEVQMEQEDINQDKKSETNNQNNDQLQLRQCGVKNIVWMTKLINEQTTFLMYGDLLIETSEEPNDIEYGIQLCDTFLKKKSVLKVQYDKGTNMIEINFSNNQPGLVNYQYVKQRLLHSQNAKKYIIAQKIDAYEQNSNEIYVNFMRFFSENDIDMVRQSQQEFIQNMTKQFIETMQLNGSDFYQYVFFSYIDEHDIGHPVQLRQGICEASCALFGFEREEVVELMQRYGFIERIFMKGFYNEYNENETVNQMILMTNVEQITKIPILYNNFVNMTTADGILFRIWLTVRQQSQVYNGVTITTMYTSEFHIEPEELQRIIEIRQSKSNQFSPYNYSDLILSKSPYNINAEKFAQYISNSKNFRPKQMQDFYPEKTCKYRSKETKIS